MEFIYFSFASPGSCLRSRGRVWSVSGSKLAGIRLWNKKRERERERRLVSRVTPPEMRIAAAPGHCSRGNKGSVWLNSRGRLDEKGGSHFGVARHGVRLDLTQIKLISYSYGGGNEVEREELSRPPGLRKGERRTVKGGGGNSGEIERGKLCV